MRRNLELRLRQSSVEELLERRALRAVFQPIVQLADGAVVGHESLIRGPVDSPLHMPDALFRAARSEGLGVRLERACLLEALSGWTAGSYPNRLFVNLSASAFLDLYGTATEGHLAEAMGLAAVAPSALVIEITEHEHVGDLPRLLAAATALRALGLRFALDDFGDGRSSLRLWAELRPEIVKIDRYFVHAVDHDAVKVQTLKGLTRFAETFGTTLLAEGIETEAELRVMRDLGIELGQGYLLGRPAEVPARTIGTVAASVIASTEIAVLPELTRAAGTDFMVERLAIPTPPISPAVSTDEVARMFASEPLLGALAIVDGGRPVGLITRRSFVDRYARPYFRELYGRKPCMLFANPAPLVLDRNTGFDALTAVLRSPDQRYLTEGFVVTAGGRYVGIGTGEQLVRVVTERRIEAARHANPLTYLPGNIPISEHITRLLGAGADFVACYGDLNDFKPYNDQYGYWRGDEMIRLVARTLVTNCDPLRDFIGHVGGDDFVILFQSSDWMERCERSIATFNERARALFDDEALLVGGINAEDRHGVMRFFRFTTLSIGAVPIRPGAYSRPEDVASAAAAAKHKAKLAAQGLAIEGC
jgi:diguanylate cyclase (GGDEF)-like protein